MSDARGGFDAGTDTRLSSGYRSGYTAICFSVVMRGSIIE